MFGLQHRIPHWQPFPSRRGMFMFQILVFIYHLLTQSSEMDWFLLLQDQPQATWPSNSTWAYQQCLSYAAHFLQRRVCCNSSERHSRSFFGLLWMSQVRNQAGPTPSRSTVPFNSHRSQNRSNIRRARKLSVVVLQLQNLRLRILSILGTSNRQHRNQSTTGKNTSPCLF